MQNRKNRKEKNYLKGKAKTSWLLLATLAIYLGFNYGFSTQRGFALTSVA